MKVERGEIYYADLNPVVGSEQGGKRPVLIIQNNRGNIHSSTIIVAALTTQTNKDYIPTHLKITERESGLFKDSTVLLEQIRTIDKSRLSRRVGHLTEKTMIKVDEILDLSLGVKREDKNLNLINIQNQNGTLTVSSREVAENFEKDHKHVLESIRNLAAGISATKSLFIENSYENRGKQYPEYQITKDGFSLLVMGFTGQKALEWKLKYIEAFNKMEEQIKNPLTDLMKDPIMAMRYEQLKLQERLDQTVVKLQLTESRLNNLDGIEIHGDDQQKLNAMIRKYALKKGLLFDKAWGDFKQAYNTAYRTNLEALINNYKTRNNVKSITLPQYLKFTDKLQDALRVADKMLNVS